MNAPLILTLQIDDEAQAFYEKLREQFFPAERNLIPAHLTLFHQLPDEENIRGTVEAIARNATLIPLERPTVRFIGNGVMVSFQSSGLMSLHAHLASRFASRLIAQDLQPFRPHIVVQNKVAQQTARETFEQLSGLNLMRCHAIGISVWRYLGGPWEHVCDLPFLAGSVPVSEV